MRRQENVNPPQDEGSGPVPCYGHGKAESKRQLAVEQFKGEITLGGGTINPGDECGCTEWHVPEKKSSDHPPPDFVDWIDMI